MIPPYFIDYLYTQLLNAHNELYYLISHNYLQSYFTYYKYQFSPTTDSLKNIDMLLLFFLDLVKLYINFITNATYLLLAIDKSLKIVKIEATTATTYVSAAEDSTFLTPS